MKIERSISIAASSAKIWHHLTEPFHIKNWIGEPEMNIKISTNWVVGSPIIIKGTYPANFVNKGKVLHFIPEQLIQYSHLSSLSNLPDEIENYCLISFHLIPEKTNTKLTVTVENFPTDAIYRHWNFYWQVTLSILKQQLERQSD